MAKRTLGRAKHPKRMPVTPNVLVSTLDCLQTGVALLTSEGVFQYANARFAELTGFAPHENLRGKNLKQRIAARDWSSFNSALQRPSREPVQGDLTVVAGGTTRFVRMMFKRIANRPKLLCVTASEQTELIETNRALQRSEGSLQSLSARLLKVQDEERRKLARDLHDNTGQDVAVLCMSLRKVIAEMEDAPDASREDLQDCIGLATKIDKGLRTLSYILHPPMLDELGLRAAISWFVAGFTKRSGIKLDVTIPRDLPRFSERQETALFNVLQSSLANVLRHSGSESASVSVVLEHERVQLTVEDKGKGMTPAQLEAARMGAAVGVGIAGMRERMSELNGTLEIESGPKGTRVRAILPVDAQISFEESADPSSDASRSSPQPAARSRILVADDHEVMRRGIKNLLASEPDFEVIGEAVDGAEAVAKSQEFQPDLVILDVTMPRVGGLAAATRIRQVAEDSKILIFSAHETPLLIDTLRATGCEGFVSKERAGTDLVIAIRRVLKGGRFYPEAVG